MLTAVGAITSTAHIAITITGILIGMDTIPGTVVTILIAEMWWL